MEHFSEVNWASELGLDLAKLEQERFSSLSHWIMLTEHNVRVKSYNAGLEQQEKEEAFLARVAALRNAGDYTFSDEMVQMAIESLNAKGAV